MTVQCTNVLQMLYYRQLFSNVDDLKIVMQGVEIMNDDPEEVDVLYGMVHLNVPKYNNSLQQFVTGIADRFANGGKMSIFIKFHEK